MKLLQIDIENFGIFSNQQLDFSSGLHIVYGPNEAGKSTLLQLIRGLLFGFPHRSPYAWSPGEMAATVQAELDNGRKLQFRRRKGRNATVVGSFVDNQELVDADRLVSLLGSATEDLYQHVFGFSLDELSRGEQSLNQASLSEALYGGGMGGLGQFQQLQQTITQQSEELFKPNARTRRINDLLSRIGQANKELRDAAVSPREYTQLRNEHQELLRQLVVSRETQQRLRAEHRRLERLKRALPPWIQLRHLEQELESITVPTGLAANAAEQFELLQQRQREIDDQLAAAQRELEECSARLQGLKLAPQILAEEASIRALNQQIGQMTGFVQDLPQRRLERQAILSEVTKMLTDLDPRWTLEHLDLHEAGLAQMGRVKEMAAEHAKLRSKLEALQSRRPELVEKLEQYRNRLAQLPADDGLPLLEELAEQSATYEQNKKQCAELTRGLRGIEQQIAQTRRQLQSGIGFDGDHFESLTVPREAVVEEFRQKFQTAAAEALRLQQAQREAEQHISRQREDLARLDAGMQVPDRSVLLGQRERRDRLWSQLRQQMIEGTHPKDLLNTSADLYEREVETADRLADERQAQAEIVAKREQLEASLEQSERRLGEIIFQQQQAIVAHKKLEQQWCEPWSQAGIIPGSPELMRDWLNHHRRLLELVERQSHDQLRLAELKQEMDLFEQSARQAIGSENATVELVARLKQKLRCARDVDAERRRLQTDLPDLQRRLEMLDCEIRSVQQTLAEWNERWAVLVHSFGFPSDWSAELARDILSGLFNARSRYSEVTSLNQRIADMEQGLEEFEKQVRQVCDTCAKDLMEHQAIVAAQQLQQRLDQAKQAAQQHEALTEKQGSLRRQLSSLEEQKRQRQDELQQLLATAGVQTPEQFLEVAQQVKLHAQWTNEINSLRREIRAIRETEDAAVFEQQLACLNSDELEIELSTVAEKLAEAEAEHQRLAGLEGETREKLRRLDTQSISTKISAELESHRAALRDAVDQWAPLVLARFLMAKAVQKFEREHQPAMLRDVASLFRQMTNERYVNVHRQLDATGTLLVEDADGKRKEPKALSTGTREQLYLAIRLAYIRHYCQDAESLPVVMDDVLVNFDAQRAESTLEALLSVSQQVQILFLTCHQHTVEMAQSRHPEIEVTSLSNNHAFHSIA